MDTAQLSSGSAAAALLTGLIALVLIYLVAEFSPKIAKFVDGIFGHKQEEQPPVKAEDYKVMDIYEGEMNLDDKENP